MLGNDGLCGEGESILLEELEIFFWDKIEEWEELLFGLDFFEGRLLMEVLDGDLDLVLSPDLGLLLLLSEII